MSTQTEFALSFTKKLNFLIENSFSFKNAGKWNSSNFVNF
jgi:hypothetical protein